jgi:hypothetical protein
VDPGVPASPVNDDAIRLRAIETYASGRPHVARRDSLAARAERDRARELRPKVIRPINMSGPELLAVIDRLSGRLAA